MRPCVSKIHSFKWNETCKRPLAWCVRVCFSHLDWDCPVRPQQTWISSWGPPGRWPPGPVCPRRYWRWTCTRLLWWWPKWSSGPDASLLWQTHRPLASTSNHIKPPNRSQWKAVLGAGHRSDLWERKLQKNLLLLIHEINAGPVYSHDHVILGETWTFRNTTNQAETPICKHSAQNLVQYWSDMNCPRNTWKLKGFVESWE